MVWNTRGLLMAFLLLKRIQKSRDKGESIPYWMMYVHRYWRLTMPYAFVLMMWLCVYPYMFIGPVWPGEDLDPLCGSNWWTNLLYVSNVVNTDHVSCTTNPADPGSSDIMAVSGGPTSVPVDVWGLRSEQYPAVNEAQL
ncbi:nose resistant to fluoxetine protein 6-like [Branchiostoma floridae x Branchiostoma belcheri]